MDKYTFITNYQYGEKTDVLQIDAVSMKVAMSQWVYNPQNEAFRKNKTKRSIS